MYCVVVTEPKSKIFAWTSKHRRKYSLKMEATIYPDCFYVYSFFHGFSPNVEVYFGITVIHGHFGYFLSEFLYGALHTLGNGNKPLYN